MASYRADGVTDRGAAGRIKSANSSSGSSECSTDEVRRLFQACDRDGDGYIDSQDLMDMCRQLNMEDAVDEIMSQLGVAQQGRISFNDFVRCRMQLITEIEEEKLRQHRLVEFSEQQGLVLPTHTGIGVDPDSQDYDSQTPNLYRLLETHEVDLYNQCQNNEPLAGLLDVCNSLHLAALTSLKGEIIELNTRLQQTLAEKELIEKQLHKYQTDKLRLQRECEERLEQQTVRYEDRITELHSVIAELQKKFDRHHINVIREEDEEQYEESDGVPSNRSAEELSLNENNANESQSASLADIGNEINAELSRVVSQLESAISESQQQTEHISGNNLLVNKQDKAIQVCPDISTEPMEGLPANMADIINRVRFLEKEVSQLQQQNVDLQTQVGRQETELNKLRAQNGGLREEKERLKSKVKEYQSRLHSIEAASPRNSTTSTPTKHHTGSRSSVERSGSSPNLTDHQGAPVSKVAELKKIKTWTSSERPVLGTDLTAMRLPMNAKVAEHLVQKLKESSDIQEIAQYANKQGADVTEPRIKEFEIEVERLQSKIDHLKSQNDLTCLSLAESKAHCDRLTVLIGKYESNHTAMQLALSYCDQALEAYQVLVSLLDSENTLLLSKCRAAGLANYGFGADTDQSDEDIATIIQNAQSAHKSAENIAKQLLLRLDRSNHSHFPGSSPSPWEDISSNSRTTSTTSSTASSVDTEWTKLDEQKLRECIQQLQMERASVKTTVLELESVHIDPMLQEAPGPSPESQKLDLENAVLMQELMAIKEERAELKSMNYVLDKEKTSLELKIFGLQCKEEAYQQRIKDLQMEIAETKNDQREAVSPSVTVENMKSMDTSQILQELHQALHREKALKARVKELINSLEYMSQNSEYRHQQSTAFINDLKKANSALIEAFEKAKKKYQAKLKKQETQIQQLKAKYEQQVGSLVYTIQQLKSESTHRAASETSL